MRLFESMLASAPGLLAQFPRPIWPGTLPLIFTLVFVAIMGIIGYRVIMALREWSANNQQAI